MTQNIVGTDLPAGVDRQNFPGFDPQYLHFLTRLEFWSGPWSHFEFQAITKKFA
jgi:hypothetical protein